MAFIWRQILQLYLKTLLIAAVRRPISTLVRALVFPIVLVSILIWTETALNPPQYFGVGSASPILSLPDALARSSANRNNLAFIIDEKAGDEIQKVYDDISNQVRSVKGKSISRASGEEALPLLCKISERGSSNCFGAVTIRSSPNWPTKNGIWNYTIRADETLGNTFDVRKQDNDAQIYLLPLQLALDQAMVSQTPGKKIPSVQQYPYTAETEAERRYDTHQSYLRTGTLYFSVIFFLAMVGIMYQATGLMAYEREAGLSELIDAMMPNKRPWVSRMVRLVAHILAFTTIYLPGWLIIGILIAVKVYTFTNKGIIIAYHIYIGVALVSSSLFGAAFFKKAQLSGIAISVVAVVMAVVPQVLPREKWTYVTISALSLFFPSSCYVYFLLQVGNWEVRGLATKFSKPPGDPWPTHYPGYVVLICPLIHIIVYPLLALLVEKLLYGTASKGRKVVNKTHDNATVRLTGFCKTYKRRFFNSGVQTKAVQNLDLVAQKGQIYMLLGPNGSGKSTTMNAIAGLTKVSSGLIEVDGSGGLGITPQKNVLWDELTVREHARMFYNLKTAYSKANKVDIDGLLDACDIKKKANAKVKTLSGGQKRKIQLAMMFAGNSAVCCIDEASSGLDPLSRRKIWDILLAQRASRTIILTTHFLDEADFLSDHIAILSRGKLQAEGSTAELKHRYGKGYTIDASRSQRPSSKKAQSITVASSGIAADVMAGLEREGILDYKVSGPTLEDVFLQLTGSSLTHGVTPDGNGDFELQTIHPKNDNGVSVTVDEVKGIDLQTGSEVSAPKLMWILFFKRVMVFKSKWGPYLSALIVALIGAGVSPLFIKNFQGMQCVYPPDLSAGATPISGYQSSLSMEYYGNLTGGPFTSNYAGALAKVAKLYDNGNYDSLKGSNGFLQVALQKNVSSLGEFNDYIGKNRVNTPGGFWLGDASSGPVIAWAALPLSIYFPLMVQNIISNMVTDVPIYTTFSAFNNKPQPPRMDFGPILVCIYLTLVLCLYPAFYALYPTVERLRQARALQYSNGVRPLPMWQAYLTFDGAHVLIISIIATALLSLTAKTVWFHVPYLFIILFLYGIASTILGYIISLFAKSQLSAWAFSACGQAVMCLINFGVYLGISASSDIADLNANLSKVEYAIGIFSPIANVQRSLFVALNQFLITCGNNSNPAAPSLYGTPIGYLVMQCVLLFAGLIIVDSGLISKLSMARSGKTKQKHIEETGDVSESRTTELRRTQDQTSGLRVMNLNKSFGKNKAVDDVTFGINKSEIFALLGPNGAGKSTAISLIRGDIKPSSSDSTVEVDHLSLFAHRAKARSQLGVCPQFDACDVLSVYDHLKFYARVRGVKNPAHNAEELIRVFGLEPYRHQLASKLSGGTKRKLSLAIAMAGNPAVLLLDEPSSGLDAASKRTMWKNLSAVSSGRSILLTTHSMEEADALAHRAAIMSSRILAIDTCDQLRRQWGDVYHVHLVMKSAPHTNETEMQRLKQWVVQTLEGAELDQKTYCGQLRFTIPTRQTHQGARGVGQLFNVLERNKEALGVEYYAIGETTLDEVFVKVVRGHGGVEEGDAR